MSTFGDFMSIFGITIRNALKKYKHIPGIRSFVREIDLKISEMGESKKTQFAQ